MTEKNKNLKSDNYCRLLTMTWTRRFGKARGWSLVPKSRLHRMVWTRSEERKHHETIKMWLSWKTTVSYSDTKIVHVETLKMPLEIMATPSMNGCGLLRTETKGLMQLPTSLASARSTARLPSSGLNGRIATYTSSSANTRCVENNFEKRCKSRNGRESGRGILAGLLWSVQSFFLM